MHNPLILIKNSRSIAGFSLIEVLIATLLFSIVILGLTNYTQVLITRHHHFYTRLQAHRVAFQLLESYPELTEQIVARILPINWQYQINSSAYNYPCKQVKITIILSNGNSVQQQRLFCQNDYN